MIDLFQTQSGIGKFNGLTLKVLDSQIVKKKILFIHF